MNVLASQIIRTPIVSDERAPVQASQVICDHVAASQVILGLPSTFAGWASFTEASWLAFLEANWSSFIKSDAIGPSYRITASQLIRENQP